MKLPGIRNGNKKSHICRATGGRVPEDISEGALPMMDSVDAEGGFAAPRLDRPAPKKSSAPVNVNVTVMNSKPAAPDLPPPMPPMAGPPPPPMGGLPPPGGPPMPMRKDGGRVNKPGISERIDKALEASSKPRKDMSFGEAGKDVAKSYGRTIKMLGDTAVGVAKFSPQTGYMAAKGLTDPQGTAKSLANSAHKIGAGIGARKANESKKPERASGGRIDAGAGGGLGRLEKAGMTQRADGGRVNPKGPVEYIGDPYKDINKGVKPLVTGDPKAPVAEFRREKAKAERATGGRVYKDVATMTGSQAIDAGVDALTGVKRIPENLRKKAAAES